MSAGIGCNLRDGQIRGSHLRAKATSAKQKACGCQHGMRRVPKMGRRLSAGLLAAMLAAMSSQWSCSAFHLPLLKTAHDVRHARLARQEPRARLARRACMTATEKYMVQAATAEYSKWCVSDCIRVPWPSGITRPCDEGDLAVAAQPTQAGVALDVANLAIKWKSGERGNKMAKGGFGWVYFGAYDASDFAGAAYKDVKVVVKLPTGVCVLCVFTHMYTDDDGGVCVCVYTRLYTCIQTMKMPSMPLSARLSSMPA